MMVDCWKCNRKNMEQEYGFHCSWCGANLQEAQFHNSPCPKCGIDLAIHSEFGAKKCLNEIEVEVRKK